MVEIAQREDRWSAGEAYEPYVGRWSRLVAAAFVDRLGVPAGARWRDVGCGTGALSEVILDRAKACQVVGVDPAEAFLDFARRRVGDSRVQFRHGDIDSRAVEIPIDFRNFDDYWSPLPGGQGPAAPGYCVSFPRDGTRRIVREAPRRAAGEL